ncbi:hypothetical protein DFJ74DRAFT_655582 [Hyaloraphidium curvatum]|nr:hypothetical protein DFJ74DRAFT_655582 [Hyaloraphidium curvatum]
MSSPPLELGRHVELFRRSLTPRQAGPPDSLTPYDPDGCLANATFSWSEGDCGLVERYLSAGAVPLFRRNRLAMAGGRQDADGHSCAVEYWEPGRAGSCCGYSPRAVENMALHPEIRIDCDGEGRVTGISWGIREGQLANYEWLYLPSLEYLRIFGRRAAGAPRPQAVNGPFPAWVHRHVNLKYLFVEDTSMDGEIKDLSDLYNLETLHINNNLFTGSIPVLPANLHALSLVNNNFGGVISSDSFPRSLQYCAL